VIVSKLGLLALDNVGLLASVPSGAFTP
jgi:hypothetical protein